MSTRNSLWSYLDDFICLVNDLFRSKLEIIHRSLYLLEKLRETAIRDKKENAMQMYHAEK